MAAKQELSLRELIESHKPKNFKYYIDLQDEGLVELEKEGYPLSELDTINDTELIQAAMSASYEMYDRSIVARAKEPSILDNGVMLTKKMATKTDKKLQNVGVGYFDLNNVSYVAIKLIYERFNIYEIFITI